MEKKVTPEVLAEMIRLRKSGLKIRAIANRVGLHAKYAEFVLREAGIVDPQIRARELKRRQVLYLRRKGWPFHRIAARLGVSLSNVKYHARHEERKATNRAAWSARKAREARAGV